MREYIESNIKARKYLVGEVYRIINPKQAKMFIKNGVYPIDIYASIDQKERDILVYVFLRDECQDVFKAWNEYSLK